jgi:flagellar hook-length control protein FliK
MPLAEGVGRAGQAEAPPRSFAPEGAGQDTPRAVPLAPENAARILGRPLPHGTVLLQLNPPELGYMQVQVQLTDGHLSAAFWADSPEVRTLLQAHFPTLQQSLNGHGFPEYQISTTLAGGEFTGQAGQFAHQQAASQFFGQGREPADTLAQGPRTPLERATYRGTTRNGLVDVTI